MKKFNDWLAVKITSGIATMWCAYVFAALAFYGLTGVHLDKPFEVVTWVSQTFLQLVLLSIIMVGQKVLSESSDKQAKEMHDCVLQSQKDLEELIRDVHANVESFRHEARGRFDKLHPAEAKKMDAVTDHSQV